MFLRRRFPSLVASLLLLGAALACDRGGPAPSTHPAPIIQQAVPVTEAVPEAAQHVLAYVRAHHQAPPGYEGGRRFGNYEHRLPEQDASGRRAQYQEWDVHPHEARRNRGAERLITSADGRAWYTGDHYRSFVEIP